MKIFYIRDFDADGELMRQGHIKAKNEDKAKTKAYAKAEKLFGTKKGVEVQELQEF